MNNKDIKGLETVGGQAIMEGVMMKSAHFYATSIRLPNGTIETEVHPFRSILEKHPFLKKPVLRGIFLLFETMILGIKTLLHSANKTQEKEEDKLTTWQTVWILIVSISMSVGLFVLLPLLLTYLVKWAVTLVDQSSILFNLVDGIFKISVFLAYVYFASLMPEIARVFQYHGAEHKSIWTWESDKELTVDKARPYTTLHPRCGTSFLVFVLVISVFIFSLVPTNLPWYVNFFWRVPLIPVIAGIGYEVLKASARYSCSWWMKILIWPGLQVQRITTKQPDDSQLEVGLESLKAVIKAEKGYNNIETSL